VRATGKKPLSVIRNCLCIGLPRNMCVGLYRQPGIHRGGYPPWVRYEVLYCDCLARLAGRCRSERWLGRWFCVAAFRLPPGALYSWPSRRAAPACLPGFPAFTCQGAGAGAGSWCWFSPVAIHTL
jgi:hypothetical protein